MRAGFGALLAAFLAVFCGCIGGGVSCRFEQRKAVGLTSASFGEYLIPMFSISEGPSSVVWQSRECESVVEFSGTATTTNRTSALGFYDSEEQKTFEFSGRFQVTAQTNAVERAETVE